MATYQIPAPLPMKLKGDEEDNWKNFKESWNDYLIATELNKKDKKIQVATLRSVMGQECRKRLTSLSLTDDQLKDPDVIVEKLTVHFTPTRNVLYDRYVYHKADQQPNETIAQYLQRLRRLVEPCKFGALTDEMLRDRLVLGCLDKAARARIFRQKECDLKSATEAPEISEATNRQLNALTGEQVHYAKSKKGGKQHRAKQRSNNTQHQSMTKQAASNAAKQDKEPQCHYCGRKHIRSKQACPAFGKTCNLCSIRNHFASQCMQVKRPVHGVEEAREETSSDIEDIHLIEVYALQSNCNKIFATINVGKEQNPVKFQLDSGATCNVINASNVPCEANIASTDKVLTMYNSSKLKPQGQCKLVMTNPKNGKRYRAEFIVVGDEVSGPLLGCKAVQQMQLLTVVQENIMEVSTTESKPLTMQDLTSEYPDVFTGLGKLPGQYHIELDTSVSPVVHPPRKVPVSLKDKLKKELDRLEQEEIISPVKDESTPWVNSMVVIDKPNKTRICLDPLDLNRAIKRCHYPMPTIEDVLPDLHNAKIFSVMDAKDGFCQVELTPESSRLTTFNTPYGRYRWNRMPFGLKSSPEEYQRRQDQALEGLQGVRSVADDILIIGKGDTLDEAIKDHNQNLKNLMQRCQEKQLKLNKDKAKLGLTEVNFIGHVITDQGLKPDQAKVQAILEMPKPTDVTGVRRIIGFVNYLSRFLPGLSDLCEPLRKLTMKDIAWHWSHEHDNAMESIKKAVTDHPVLRYYDKDEPLTIQTDASDTGLGAALIQNGQPVAYASRALTDPETRYAQIEKELLAEVWGLERFHQYTYGKQVSVQSDHKPLEIISRKLLHKAPKRLQTLLLRLQKYDAVIRYHPGKQMYLADTLSRAYIPSTTDQETEPKESINLLQNVRVTEPRLEEIRQHTKQDKTMQSLKAIILDGWPEHVSEVEPALVPYFHCRDELAVHEDIICRGDRPIIPRSLRSDMLQRIHSSHLGIEGCMRRARECLYWPSMSAEVKDYIQKCEACCMYNKKQPKESLMSHDVPNRPWAKVGTDIFSLSGKDYLMTVDYYSGFWEIDYLEDTRASTVIHKLKAHFSRYGIPDVVILDSAMQYTGSEFSNFAKVWKFVHKTSSPHHQQCNGKAEAAIKSAKTILRKSKAAGNDQYLAILDYRNTPTTDMDTSPVQRFMQRRTKTLLPTTEKLLAPKLNRNVAQQQQRKQQKQAHYYNRGANNLPELKPGEVVRVQPNKYHKEWQKAVVKARVAPRSYEVTTEAGVTLRRNRKHLRKSSENYCPQEPEPDDDFQPASNNRIPSRPGNSGAAQPRAAQQDQPVFTRSGRLTRKPGYLKDYLTK